MEIIISSPQDGDEPFRSALRPRNDRAEASEAAQKKVFAQWINQDVICRGYRVRDTHFLEDVQNGCIFAIQFEVLSGVEMKKIGKIFTPAACSMRVHYSSNVNVVLKYLESVEKIQLNLVPGDVVDGNLSKVLDFLWSVMEHYTVKRYAGGLDRDPLRKRLVCWLRMHVDSPIELTTSNLAKCLLDARVLFALLNRFYPSECGPPNERLTGDAAADLAVALTDCVELFGMERLADVNIMQESRFTSIFLVKLIAQVNSCFPDALCLTDPSLDLPPVSVAATAAAEEKLIDASIHVQMINLKKENEKLRLENMNLKSAADLAPPALKAVVIPIGSEQVEASIPATEVMGGPSAAVEGTAELGSRLLALEMERAVGAECHALKEAELRALFAAAKLVSEEEKAAAKEVLAEAVREIKGLKQMVCDKDAELRKLRDDNHTLKGCARVMVRVRPNLPGDGPGEQPSVVVDPDGKTVRVVKQLPDGSNETSHTFSFDRTFGQSDGQAEVFLEVSEFVRSALDGYNALVFSYGQTGSGKTHTMSGALLGDERGIIPRTMELVAATMVQLKKLGYSFEMKISIFEIYCETIRDLLGSGKADKKIVIQADKVTGENIVKNVEEIDVDPSDQGSIAEILRLASDNKTTGATKMNKVSSRGHTILNARLTSTNAQGVTVTSLLQLVDLAGSERMEKSGVVGQAKEETKFINSSLSAFTAVLAERGKKSSHVNYRDSKLTEVLQPSLRGNAKVLGMVAASPLEASTDETISSLRFAASVSACELGKAKRNGADAKQGAEHKSLARRSLSPSRENLPSRGNSPSRAPLKRGPITPKK